MKLICVEKKNIVLHTKARILRDTHSYIIFSQDKLGNTQVYKLLVIFHLKKNKHTREHQATMTTPQYPHGLDAFVDFVAKTPGTPYVYSGCLQTPEGLCVSDKSQPCYQVVEDPKYCALDPCYMYQPTETPDPKYHCVVDQTTKQWVRGPPGLTEYFFPFNPLYKGSSYITGF